MQHSLDADIGYILVHQSDQKWSILVKTAGFQSVFPNSIYPTIAPRLDYSFSYQNGQIPEEFQLTYNYKNNIITDTRVISESELNELRPKQPTIC